MLSCGERSCLVRVNTHEIGEPRDTENLLVVLAETGSDQRHMRLARLGQDAHDEGDAGAVDVIDIGEVEQQPFRW